jgi:2-polyprenyl-3-methyl-5-hydroxy-6-metoxy-1,4-benzoquinol methylase
MIDRISCILKYCEGREVLDIGCVGHAIPKGSRERHLYGELKKIAKSVVGTDVVSDAWCTPDVKADVENMDIGRTFDVVVAGEIIEHVNNPGIMLRNLRKHMRNDSLLVISTPNVLSTSVLIEHIIRGESRAHFEHNFWFTEKFLTHLLEKNGFAVTKIEKTLDIKGNPNLFGRAVNAIAGIFGCGDCIVACAKVRE